MLSLPELVATHEAVSGTFEGIVAAEVNVDGRRSVGALEGATEVLLVDLSGEAVRAEVLASGELRKLVGADRLDVILDVEAHHAYTVELRLSYALVDPVTGEPDPSAHVRLYRDARQAEVTHCYVGRRWQDVIGLYPPPAAVMDHRLQMNTFLGKWFGYLGERGHGSTTLRPAEGGVEAA